MSHITLLKWHEKLQISSFSHAMFYDGCLQYIGYFPHESFNSFVLFYMIHSIHVRCFTRLIWFIYAIQRDSFDWDDVFFFLWFI